MKNIIYCIFIYCFITLFINVNADLALNIGIDVDMDKNWMSLISNDTRINQINIPGTHDSGTYDVGETWQSLANLRINFLPDFIVYLTGQTQSLSITEQLYSGIRYLDIRLSVDENGKLINVHGDYVNKDYFFGEYKNLYFTDIIKSCVGFLRDNTSETIIIHLKKENTRVPDNDLAQLFTDTFENSEYLSYF